VNFYAKFSRQSTIVEGRVNKDSKGLTCNRACLIVSALDVSSVWDRLIHDVVAGNFKAYRRVFLNAARLKEDQMFCGFPKLFPNVETRQGFLLVASVIVMLGPVASHAQRPKAALDGPDGAPAFNDFKGVKIGMHADEARKKLGNPRDKSADQDFYMFGDNEAVQVFYDKGAVSAISIDFMSGANGIPSCKDVLGAEAEAKADGSVYKLIRYPKAGYWVSYSKTAGNSPTVTVTMQKID
jgi:hypothetical protein